MSEAVKKTRAPSRLYTRAVFTSYQRRADTVLHKVALLKIEGVNCKEDTDFYLGKRVAYIYKAKVPRKGVRGKTSRYRVMWGKIRRSHGSNGLVRAAFKHNLPCEALGNYLRVFLYPSRV